MFPDVVLYLTKKLFLLNYTSYRTPTSIQIPTTIDPSPRPENENAAKPPLVWPSIAFWLMRKFSMQPSSKANVELLLSSSSLHYSRVAKVERSQRATKMDEMRCAVQKDKT